ncbi:7554_t:CDS:2, partial [Entrophospora sp. SA101]
PARNGFEQLELELVEWLSENNGGRIGKTATKYAAWVNQYGWAVYDAGMDILATHNLGTNSRRYKDLYNLRDIIHTGNLAPNGWSNW